MKITLKFKVPTELFQINYASDWFLTALTHNKLSMFYLFNTLIVYKDILKNNLKIFIYFKKAI